MQKPLINPLIKDKNDRFLYLFVNIGVTVTKDTLFKKD